MAPQRQHFLVRSSLLYSDLLYFIRYPERALAPKHLYGPVYFVHVYHNGNHISR